MDKLSLFFFATLPFLVVMSLTSLHQWAGAKWKRHPGIPLWLGILLLLAMFLLHWWLEGAAEVDNSLLKTHGTRLPDAAKHVFTALATAYMRQAKFVELAVIPFAMALIGTGLVLKIEKDFARKVAKVERMKRRLQRLEDKLRKAERTALVAVLMKTRGPALLRAKEHVDWLKDERLDLQLDIRELEDELGLRDEYGFEW